MVTTFSAMRDENREDRACRRQQPGENKGLLSTWRTGVAWLVAYELPDDSLDSVETHARSTKKKSLSSSSRGRRMHMLIAQCKHAAMTTRQSRCCSWLLTLLLLCSCQFQNDAATTIARRARHDFSSAKRRNRNSLESLSLFATNRPRRLEQQTEETATTDCQATGVCEMCMDAERAVPEKECTLTGRHQHFKCVTHKGDEEVSSSMSYRSCNRTAADEEFLMIRLQAICFTIGVASLFSVRRNKQVGASLFDQRKAAAAAAAAAADEQSAVSSSLNSNNANAAEQEMVPLALAIEERDLLDVV